MNKISRFFFLFVLLSSLTALAGKTEKAWEALAVFDYFKAKTLFSATIKKEPTAASYGLAIIYYRNDNPFHDLDSATNHIRRALQSFDGEIVKKEKQFTKWKVYKTSLLALRNDIYAETFQRTIKTGNIAAFETFIRLYADAIQFEDAVSKRDSLAYEQVQLTDAWESYRGFMEKYPASKEYESAKKLYELKLFTSWTQSNSIKSYESFIEKYPKSPHVTDAENAIFALSVTGGMIDEYYLFIRKYPANRNVETAWYNIYTLYTTDFKLQSFQDFLKVFPDYPFSENVNRDMELAMLVLLPVKQNDKWGFIDTTGKVRIPCIYEWCEDYNEGLAAVGFNGKAGYISKNGTQVFPFLFDETESFSQGLAEVMKNGKYGVVRNTGKQILACEYDEVAFEDAVKLIAVKKDGKYGLVDEGGTERTPRHFDKLGFFAFGLASAEQGGKWGFIDATGKWVIPVQFEGAMGFSSNGFAEVRKGGKKGVIDRNGKLIVPCIYSEIGPLHDGLMMVADSLHYGFIDTAGKIRIEVDMDHSSVLDLASGFCNGLARAYKNGKMGLIDLQGKYVVTRDYQRIDLDQNEQDLFIVKKGGKYGVIDRKGKTIIPFQYEQFGKFFHGKAIAARSEEGEWGVIGKNRKTIIAFEYDEISPVDDEGKLFLVEYDGKFGAYKSDGAKWIETIYSAIEVSGDFARLEKDKKISWMNIKTGKVIWKEE